VKRHRQVAAFILAGGASSRMGQDKALLDFGGVPLVVHMARMIKPLVASVTVVGSPRRYVALGLRAIADRDGADQESKRLPQGPLAGMATALASTRLPWNLIAACDLPYLSESWLDWLLSRAIESHGQVVIPQTGRGLEPLAAVYRRECSRTIASALARGVRKVTDAIEELRLDIVDQREWRGLDPRGLLLKNMNMPGDYDIARKWWGAARLHEGCPAERVRHATKRRPSGTPVSRIV
jgi:molybdopterin-guanine dinucleotide biosynthesis protein A